MRIRPTDEVTGKYLFYYLNFLRTSGYFVKSQTFSVNAKFNKSAINRLAKYLSGDDERSEIVNTLDAVTRKIDVVERKRRLLEDLFRGVLHKLMTAQIRVNALDLDEILQQPVTEIGGETVNPPVVGNGRDRSLHEGSANK